MTLGLVIAILAIILVLFMIFAMALAEWADKDPGELFSKLWPKRAVPVPTAPPAPVKAVKAGQAITKLKKPKNKSTKRKIK